MADKALLRDLRDPLAAGLAAGLAVSSTVQHRLSALGRDLRQFSCLLLETFGRLPADVIAASVLINILALVMPLGILQVYDRLIPQGASATLAFLALGIVVALVADAVLRVARSHVLGWSATQRTWRQSVAAAARVATAPGDSIDQEPSARWVQRLAAVTTRSEFDLSQARLVLIDLPFVVVFLALLVATSAWLAVIPVAIFAYFGVCALERGRELRTATIERTVAEGKIRDFLVETLSGVVTLKALGMEQQTLRRFERLAGQAAASTYSVVRLSEQAQGFGSLVAILTQMATASVGALLAINGAISVGAVACATMLAGRFIQPLLRLVAAWIEIQGVIAAEQIARPLDALPDLSREPLQRHALAGPASITFDRVTFQHPGGGTTILKAASLAIAAGEIVALVGSDNIGKSTVARLIAGEIAPSAGGLLISGAPAIDPAARCSGKVAWVTQDSAIFRGTVMENMTLFRGEAHLAAAKQAAHLVGLDAEINRLARGYETRLGDVASEVLPTALLQRIAIARAIAGDPSVLILDEANASFDYAGDLALARGLARLRGGTTTILITNRPSFAAIADRRVTIVDGMFCHLAQAPAEKRVANDPARG